MYSFCKDYISSIWASLTHVITVCRCLVWAIMRNCWWVTSDNSCQAFMSWFWFSVLFCGIYPHLSSCPFSVYTCVSFIYIPVYLSLCFSPAFFCSPVLWSCFVPSVCFSSPGFCFLDYSSCYFFLHDCHVCTWVLIFLQTIRLGVTNKQHEYVKYSDANVCQLEAAVKPVTPMLCEVCS